MKEVVRAAKNAKKTKLTNQQFHKEIQKEARTGILTSKTKTQRHEFKEKCSDV